MPLENKEGFFSLHDGIHLHTKDYEAFASQIWSSCSLRTVICLDSYEMPGKKGGKECSPVCKSERKPVLLTLALAQKVGV